MAFFKKKVNFDEEEVTQESGSVLNRLKGNNIGAERMDEAMPDEHVKMVYKEETPVQQPEQNLTAVPKKVLSAEELAKQAGTAASGSTLSPEEIERRRIEAQKKAKLDAVVAQKQKDAEAAALRSAEAAAKEAEALERKAKAEEAASKAASQKEAAEAKKAAAEAKKAEAEAKKAEAEAKKIEAEARKAAAQAEAEARKAAAQAEAEAKIAAAQAERDRAIETASMERVEGEIIPDELEPVVLDTQIVDTYHKNELMNEPERSAVPAPSEEEISKRIEAEVEKKMKEKESSSNNNNGGSTVAAGGTVININLGDLAKQAQPQQPVAPMPMQPPMYPNQQPMQPMNPTPYQDMSQAYSDLQKQNRPTRAKKLTSTVVGLVKAAIIICIIALFAITIGFNYVFNIVQINGISMEPTLQNDDFVILDVLSYKMVNSPQYDDIIVLETSNGEKNIKRIVAMPGDSVEIRDGYLYVNGSKKTESNYTKMADPGIAADGVFLREGEYFVLGDNRNASVDSRVYGVVQDSQIVGYVVKVVPQNTAEYKKVQNFLKTFRVLIKRRES